MAHLSLLTLGLVVLGMKMEWDGAAVGWGGGWGWREAVSLGTLGLWGQSQSKVVSAEMPPLGKVARVSKGVLGSWRLPTSPHVPAITWKHPVIPLPLPLSCEP